MKDPRIICRDDLLATMRDEYDGIIEEAVSVAKLGCEEGMTRDRGVEVVCLLREAYVIDRLREEIQAATKHTMIADAGS